MISAIVPAAGNSTRMGSKDKLLLPFGRSTILGTVLDNLYQSKAAEIILVVGAVDKILRASGTIAAVRKVVNRHPEQGLTGSIQLGVQQAANEATGYLICLADMPLLSSDDYNLLINRFLSHKSKSILVPFYNKQRGNPILFSYHFREQILAAPAGNGCKPVVMSNPEAVVAVPVANNHFIVDIDTEEDYRQQR